MSSILAIAGLSVVATTAVFLITVWIKDESLSQIFFGAATPFSIEQERPIVQFVLYTRENPAYNLRIGDKQGFRNSGFNISNPTKIIIHGFQSSIKEEIFVLNKNAYLESDDYNVIGMDWSKLCDIEYLMAVQGAHQAGKTLSSLLLFIGNMGQNLDDIHLIGHSLGAHVAAMAANNLKLAKIGRITGLDPAGPGFGNTEPAWKLDSSDAKLVDVIHTYIKILSLTQPLGHVDFYPNGGQRQPGCPDITNLWHVGESLVCNHARAYEIFAESIRNKKAFKSKKCNSVDEALEGKCLEDTNVHLGQSETYKPGLYYVRTGSKEPFNIPEDT